MARGEAKKITADSPVLSRACANIVVPTEALAPEVKHRIEVIQRLQSYQDRDFYGSARCSRSATI